MFFKENLTSTLKTIRTQDFQNLENFVCVHECVYRLEDNLDYCCLATVHWFGVCVFRTGSVTIPWSLTGKFEWLTTSKPLISPCLWCIKRQWNYKCVTMPSLFLGIERRSSCLYGTWAINLVPNCLFLFTLKKLLLAQ